MGDRSDILTNQQREVLNKEFIGVFARNLGCSEDKVACAIHHEKHRVVCEATVTYKPTGLKFFLHNIFWGDDGQSLQWEIEDVELGQN